MKRADRTPNAPRRAPARPLPAAVAARPLPPAAQVAVLERRIARLERRARAGRWLLAAIALPLLWAAAQAPARVLQAESFVLRGPDGKQAASLGLVQGRPALALYDAAGRLRVALAVEAEGALLNFFTDHGTPRLVAGQRGDGSLLVLHDGDGAPRAAIAVRDASGPSLYLLDANLDPLFRKP